MRPFVVKEQPYLIPEKSVFNRITGDNQLERDFASFVDNCPDVVSFAKNYFALGFKLDYVNDDGNIANYHPDFFVKLADGRMIVAETKGRKDVDVDPKTRRLAQWCEDINTDQSDVVYDFVYVDEDSFREYTPRTFQQLLEAFTVNTKPDVGIDKVFLLGGLCYERLCFLEQQGWGWQELFKFCCSRVCPHSPRHRCLCYRPLPTSKYLGDVALEC